MRERERERERRLTKYVQPDDLCDRPPAYTIVRVADVVPGVGPGEVGHAQCLAGHGLVGAESPGEGLVVLPGPVDVRSGLARGSALQPHPGAAADRHRPVTRGDGLDGRAH